MRSTITLLTFLIFSISIYAANIRGVVTEVGTNEQLIGAIVLLKNTNYNASTGLDGSYTIREVPNGTYTLVVQYIGYQTQETSITVNDNKDITLNFVLQSSSQQLQEVEIKGEHDKESDQNARVSERNADNMLNILSAKTISLLPDISVGSVLQRVSGISMERNSTGEGRYANIRGMDQRYSYTSINGIKIPSPDNANRYVPMDIFPADLIERLEVNKTLTPNMEGDAIAGAMNLVMKSAPDQLTINSSAAIGVSQLALKQGFVNFNQNGIQEKSPAEANGPTYVYTPNDFNYNNFQFSNSKFPANGTFNLSIGNRFFKNKKLGIIVAGSYQSLNRSSSTEFFKQDAQPSNQIITGVNNYPAFTEEIQRQTSSHQTRYGLHSKIDYKFNQNHKLNLYLLYVGLDESQYRYTLDTNLSVGRQGLGSGVTTQEYRTRVVKQNIFNTTLQGDHSFFTATTGILTHNLKFNWSGVYSIATNDNPNWDTYTLIQQNTGTNQYGPYTLSGGSNNPALTRQWLKNSDQDVSGYANLLYNIKIANHTIELSGGGLYRQKTRNNNYYNYNFIATQVGNQVPPFTGTISPSEFYIIANTGGGNNSGLTYSAGENILAYYGQLKYNALNRFELIGGARIEATDQSYNSQLSATIAGKSAEVLYSDFLPSLNLKYKLNTKMNLRGGYYAAINRANFYELIPYSITYENFTETGNYNLKHATSDNFDLRYEWFPQLLDQLLVGVFYKNIYNPIEKVVVGSTIQPKNPASLATNFGAEISLIKYFFRYFGVSGNYTYTNSSITTSKTYYELVNGSNITINKDQTRPMAGQAPHIANLSLLFKHPNLGLDVQVAGVYTGTKLALVSPWYDLDYWQRQMFTLDFSAEKKINSKFTLFCKVTNILNTPVILEIHQPYIPAQGAFALSDQPFSNSILAQRDYFGQSYLLGLRFKL